MVDGARREYQRAVLRSSLGSEQHWPGLPELSRLRSRAFIRKWAITIVVETFVVVVVGGLGNLRGSFYASLIVGMTNAIVAGLSA